MSKIKICGLKTLQDIKIVNKYLPDYIGFILAPSKRQITLEQARLLKRNLTPSIKVVGVFVNEKVEVIKQYVDEKIIDIVQLHGDETSKMANEIQETLKIPVIKVYRVKDELGLELIKEDIANLNTKYILFDTYHEKNYGGSGESFDWSLLKDIESPYFLAGGIGENNIDMALKLEPEVIDLSSSVETNGMKDESKVSKMINYIRDNS